MSSALAHDLGRAFGSLAGSFARISQTNPNDKLNACRRNNLAYNFARSSSSQHNAAQYNECIRWTAKDQAEPSGARVCEHESIERIEMDEYLSKVG